MLETPRELRNHLILKDGIFCFENYCDGVYLGSIYTKDIKSNQFYIILNNGETIDFDDRTKAEIYLYKEYVKNNEI